MIADSSELRSICRLALHMRRPLTEIASWPARQVRVMEKFMQRESTPEQRLEILLARVTCDFFDFSSTRGSPRSEMTRYLPFLRAWEQQAPRLTDERYSDLDREILGKLR